MIDRMMLRERQIMNNTINPFLELSLVERKQKVQRGRCKRGPVMIIGNAITIKSSITDAKMTVFL